MTALPPTPSFDLTGRRALVAGGSNGIGLGCATALARAGAEVTVAARREAPVAEAVAALRAEGHAAHGACFDIADLPGMRAAVAASGPFDILVNSAGTARHAPAAATLEADFDAVSDANFKGAYFLAQAAAQGMIAAGIPGAIITISSQMGHISGPERALYSATKHAVEGFTKGMALEWGPRGIRVNSIGPTFIRTPLTAPTFADPQKRAWLEEKIALPRIGEPGDIGGAAVFLASDAAAMITGTCLLVDGGWTAA